jgi:hypothetical protein
VCKMGGGVLNGKGKTMDNPLGGLISRGVLLYWE